jgi:hypothetical protein
MYEYKVIVAPISNFPSEGSLNLNARQGWRVVAGGGSASGWVIMEKKVS